MALNEITVDELICINIYYGQSCNVILMVRMNQPRFFKMPLKVSISDKMLLGKLYN